MNATPFHRHHQHKTTTTAYIGPLIQLVSSLVRGGFDEFVLPTSVDVRKALAMLEQKPDVQGIHALFLALFTKPWYSQGETGSSFADPTICFLALSTLQEDGTFAEAKDVTGTIAKLTRAIKLTVLTEIHNQVHSKQQPNNVHAFRLMEPFIVESEASTFQSLRFYQHFATSVAYDTPSLPRIIWKNRAEGVYDEMIYEATTISIDQIKTIFRNIEAIIMQTWKEEVCFGVEFDVPTGSHRDNLRLTRRGYSFINEPGNGYTKYGHALGARFFKDPRIKGKFIQQIPETDDFAFNVTGCHQWLKALAKVEAHLAVLIDMTSGAPMRMTELTSTLACNIETRTRNLYALDKKIIIVRQYTKNSNNQQADKVIPHSLSSFCADMLLRIHVLARPLAQVTTCTVILIRS
jgi:bloom syndrome protein